MNSARVRFEVLSDMRSSGDHVFVERVIDGSIFRFGFTDDIRKGNAIDTRDDR